VSLERRRTVASEPAGYTIAVHGPNARVNIHSTDNSTNTATTHTVFADMRRSVENGVADEDLRKEIVEKIDRAEREVGKPGFVGAYQDLVATAADHVTIIAPFLPALTQFLG